MIRLLAIVGLFLLAGCSPPTEVQRAKGTMYCNKPYMHMGVEYRVSVPCPP